MKKYFEVSAQWMKTCGFGDVAAVFPVKLVETNMIGGNGFDAFLELETNGDSRFAGANWTVAAARGRFVDAPLEQATQVNLTKASDDREVFGKVVPVSSEPAAVIMARAVEFVQRKRAALALRDLLNMNSPHYDPAEHARIDALPGSEFDGEVLTLLEKRN